MTTRTIKDFSDLEALNKLVADYKSLSYQLKSVYPTLTGLAGHTKNSGNLVSLHFSPEIAASITQIGQKQLAELTKQLKEYGIEL